MPEIITCNLEPYVKFTIVSGFVMKSLAGSRSKGWERKGKERKGAKEAGGNDGVRGKDEGVRQENSVTGECKDEGRWCLK